MAKHRRESISIVKETDSGGKLRLRPDVAFGNLQRALQRSLDLAALGLQRSSGELNTLPSLQTFPRVQLGSRLSPEELTEHYSAWIMGHTINDFVEALEPLLTDLTKICRALNAIDQRAVKLEEIGEIQRVEDLNVPLGQKIALISEEFPALISSEVKEALRTLNKLRVCLTHAGGRVRDRDCNVAGALEVSQVFWEFWIEYESGKSEPLVPNVVTSEPGHLVMRRSREPKRFKIDEQISLAVTDLERIAYTIFELCLGLRKNLYLHLKKKGFLPQDFKEPEKHATVRVKYMNL